MKSLFAHLTRLSLRFRLVTLTLSVLFAVFGVVAATQLKLELIPSIQFPQLVILAQSSGMTSDEVLEVLTKRLETELDQIPEIVNIESTTAGVFGSVLIARNEFGVNQEQLQQRVQTALNNVWLPVRRFDAPPLEDPTAFATTRLADLTGETLVYFQENQSTFLFQLSPEVWQALSPDAVETALRYLALQTRPTEGASELQRIVELDVVPQIKGLPVVADVSVSGGQALPGEGEALLSSSPAETEVSQSLLLDLSPQVWAVASTKVGGVGTLGPAAVDQLSDHSIEVPTTPPPLPTSWHTEDFATADDLLEIATPTRSLADAFNTFLQSGEIVGPLGTTEDLTPEIVRTMLDIAPSMVAHFEAEHLAALAPEVFAVLPQDYIDSLDGFARDELAAAALGRSLTGEEASRASVDLPSAWRIAPPQLITFSLDDLPLATFSVFSEQSVITAQSSAETVTVERAEPEPTVVPTADTVAPPSEGPAIPTLLTVLGEQLGVPLDTADDLLRIQLPAEFAAMVGSDTLDAAEFLNFLTLLDDVASSSDDETNALPGFDPASVDMSQVLPALVECGINPLALTTGNADIGGALIGCLDRETIAFLDEFDASFLDSLSLDVYEYFSNDVLSLPQVAPPLPDVWDTLTEQPVFADEPLRDVRDLLARGEGRASAVLNRINRSVPEQFAGYEVRLFDSLTPGMIRYLVLHEENFFANLDAGVLEKLSPQTLALIPEAVLRSLPDDVSERLVAIAEGQQPAAITTLASEYGAAIVPADPSAPVLNEDWGMIANFYSIELDTADDFFRFPEGFRFESAAALMNSIFDSPQGVAFAPALFGGLTPEVVEYLLVRDPDSLTEVVPQALQLLTAVTRDVLPQELQERVLAGGEPFVPQNVVTRSNGSPSLQLTVYKTADANTVEAFHEVAALLEKISAESEAVEIGVVFEQASFIEESISGVAREGGLGGVFAVLMILVFLSNGHWARSPRRRVGGVLVALSLIALALATLPHISESGSDLGVAFAQVNLLLQVPLLILLAAGLLFLIWPGALPYPAWRSTLVTAVSIPLSVLMALTLMRWLSPTVHGLLSPLADTPVVAFILRLFPESITLNIMTLSGLTVAIGRVVDDSIVVLENIFRQLREGGDKRQAILKGTRDVSIAIFAATVITVVVFLPLGLTGGIIGEFFLPFGLAVTYALLASFLVAITVVPVLVYWFVKTDTAQEQEAGLPERIYLPVLRWSLSRRVNQLLVLGIAVFSMVVGLALFGTRPVAFLPDFGEPQIAVNINLPANTRIVETNRLVQELEAFVEDALPREDIKAVETIVGGGGLSLDSLIGAGGNVNENQAQVTIGVESQDKLNEYAQTIRAKVEDIFGEDNVTVSAASIAAQSFGAFSLIVSGPQETLELYDSRIIETLNNIEGLTNVSSNLAQIASIGEDAPAVYLRVDREPAVSYTGELETEDTLTVIQEAKAAVLAIPDLPTSLSISEGFESEVQTEGFASLFVAMGVAIVIVVAILIITFGSVVHWLDIILSIIVAPVGAAVALTLANRVLGISAMIGLLMLIGIVVTNAVVLIDRVMANRRERGMPVREALLEAGARRLRPILMTALATIFALLPLAVGLSEGAIIASELGTVVIGGLFSSTLLTLIVVPVAYQMLNPLHERLRLRRGGRTKEAQEWASQTGED